MSQSPTLHDLYRDIEPDLSLVETEIRKALDSSTPEIAEMARHASGLGGKRMRPAMILLVGRAAGGQSPLHAPLGAVVEMIHLATLVHDDVIDGADMRRRQRTLSSLWTPRDAVLLGDIIFARAISLLASMGDARCLETLTSALSTVCEGEILQNRRAHEPTLTRDVYDHIIDAKTAELYARGCELAAYVAGADQPAVKAFENLGRELGIAFQITDDCLDLIGEEAVVGKSLGSDLTNGKMTLPMIMLRERLDAASLATFDRVIRDGVASDSEVQQVMEWLRQHGTIDDALSQARDHVRQGLEQVRPFVSDALWPSLDAVGAFVLSRTL